MSTVIPVLYTKGSKVWVQDKETIWKYAIVKLDFVENDKQLITEDAENGSEIIVQIESVDKLPPLRNPDILIGANDLTSLSYLHEPAVLYNLRVRFLDKSAIYTWCGIVLVAVNPFSDLDIYGDETIQTYHRSSMGNTQLDPHIYAVAEDAFSKLERESRNQSIIVSGESGAGKTVSAKFAMRYFASIAGSNATSNVENRVLASNPIMEAIGNAKTTRNDNSSRFGKYIQIIFDPQSRAIVGGNMRTYLLEKSRISRQSEGERNFHIFYQMCSYAKSANLSHLGLDSWDFDYLGTQKPGNHDDIAKFNEAMHILAFTEKQQNVIYRIVAAVLHAGNIGFVRVDEEQCAIPQEDFHLTCFCELLGLDESATRTWLTQRVLRTGMKEVIVTPVVQDIAEQGRDALAKFIYEKMFAWVVSLINRALGSSSDASTFIGVLDIYGFEHFEVNSFEQFCINYANEVLQQQFNQHVFKLEQEEYVREGIDWQFITFTDNQPVIDVIEAKLGILSLLDEECRMPRGSDESWCTKLYSQIKVGEFFQQPKIGSRNSFIIQHFADKVVYTVDGFLEKNRDTVWEEQIDLLKRSTVLDSVFADEQSVDSAPQKPGGKMRITPQQQNKQTKQAKATVGSQFRDSLAALMRTLNATTPHYVRCIKSNDDKAPFDFDNVRAVQQLRACGVLETIRISSNGFPSRWTYQDFANRYRVLLVGVSQVIKKQGAASGGPPVPVPRKLVRAGSSSTSELKAVCEQIVRIVYELQVYSKFKLPVEQEQQEKSTEHLYQFGKTKIFFRAGQVALLERIRTQRLKECAILLQRMVRGWLQRKRYVKVKLAVTKLQTYARGYLARRKYWHLKCTKAATVIQTRWRGYRARKKYLELRKCAVGIQKFARGLLARRLFQSLREKRAATTIQRYWRGYMARSDYRKKLRQIVIVQSVTRRHFAQKVLKKLRIEAKSVAHVTQLNKGLERKIFELQNKIDDLNQDLTKAKSSKADLSKEKAETQKLDTAVKNMKNALSDKEKELEKLQSQLDSRDQSYGSLEKKLSESLTVIEKLKEVNKSMENRYDSKAVEEAVAQKEKTLNAKFERERKIQMEERESEKHAYQQLLRKYAALEERLQGEQNGFDGDRSPDVTTVSMMMRLSEMEQECAKLKHENQQMRELMANTTNSTDNDGAASLLAQQCAAMQQELDRAREEKTHLKTIVLGQEGSMGSKEPSGDSEVISAFKAIVKQLERELEAEKLTSDQLQVEVKSLKKDNDRQQSLIGVSHAPAMIDFPENTDIVTRLNQENILLRERNDKVFNENKKMRLEMMRMKMLGDAGHEDKEEVVNEEPVSERNQNYLGMFKLDAKKETLLINVLISDLDPTSALKFTPHLPAYIIFMCIRYTDEVNDDNLVRSLLNNTIVAMKRTVKRAMNQQKIDVPIIWLSNACKIYTLLRQYSGDEAYGVLEESLKNFDLSEYRQMFSDLAIWMYHGIIKLSEERLQPLIVPAVLEYEGLASSGIMIYSRTNQRSGSVTEDNSPESPSEKPVDTLIAELAYLHKFLLLHVVESELISQIFKQLFYFICAGALNNLLLRKDLCHWNKAMQIRFNLSALEQWCREQQVPGCNEIVEKLDPIIQATKLLQTKKTEEHIPTIVEMCYKLSSSQILKILNLYTAGDEETVSASFMKKVQQHLSESRKEESGTSLLMDTKFAFAMTIPYNATDVSLQKITLPPILMKKGLGTALEKI